MDLLNEARVQLESVVSEDLLKEYFAILRQWFLLNSRINKDEFDRQARKLLLSEEQIIAHNRFLHALLDKTSSDTTKFSKTFESGDTPKTSRSSLNKETKEFKDTGKLSSGVSRKGAFQPVEFVNYVQPLSPSRLPPGDITMRCAASELFMPDHSFISTRITLTAWENGLQGAEPSVTDLVVNCCQNFVKNILTAIISRKKGYKVRDGKFQYGFNQPIPNPFLRNYSNIIDETADSRVVVPDDDDSFVPRSKPSLERIEQQVVFAYSSTKRRKTDNILSVQLLYDTLKENPLLLGSDATHRSHLLRLNLQSDT